MNFENPFDDLGDRRAPPGSEKWARAWRTEMTGLLDSADVDVLRIGSVLATGQKFEAWKLLIGPDGKHYPTLWSVIETPRPFGCGVPAKTVKALLTAKEGNAAAVAAKATRPEAAPTKADAGKKGGRGKKASVHAREDSSHGTGGDALAARIARDAPDVHEAMKAGKYPSVRAAAKAAGIVKDPDPVRVAATAFAKVPVNRLAELVRALPEQTRRMLTTCLRDAS